MWKVTALDATGSRRDVTVVESEKGKPFHSSAFVDDAAAPITSDVPHLKALLEAQAKDPQLAFAAIETWAEQAETMARDYDWAGAPPMRRVEHAIARYAATADATAAPPERPLCMAWHERTGVLMPLFSPDTELIIEYEPDRDEEIASRRLLHRYASGDATVETLFEWRAFVGKQTGVIDGRTTMRPRGRGWVATLRGAPGFLVGAAMKLVTRPEPTLKSDPRWQSRLAELELRYRWLADECPRLDDALVPEVRDQAMVFVHGTMSCGMVSLKDLFGLAVDGWAVPGRVLRYEHDTFLPVRDNADELVKLIEDKLVARRRLVLAAHSRGGLVAVAAAARLVKNRYPAEVVVRTFGTPFRGTPLVAIGKKALTLLAKLGEEISAAVPVPVLSALAKGFFYVVDSPTLPPGIMDMHEEAGGLPWLHDAAVGLALESWGSSYDVEKGNPGFGASVEGVLLGALRGQPHDLVVPMASAIHCGTGVKPVQMCSHVHYFRQPPVRQALQGLLAPAAAGAGAPASAQAAVASAGAGVAAPQPAPPGAPSPTSPAAAASAPRAPVPAPTTASFVPRPDKKPQLRKT